VNGFSDSKAYLYDLHKALSQFDVILLTETRMDSWDESALPGYSVAFIPARQPGQAGEGFVVAVRRSPHYTVSDWGSSETTLWVRLQFLDGVRLVVGACYIPPQGSAQLQGVDVDARMVRLTSDILAALDEGYVVLGGDFNARVGGCGEGHLAAEGARGCTDSSVNGHGRKLLQLCNRTGMHLCTGRVPGDLLGDPTYHATCRSAATRLDHVLVSPSLLPYVCSSSVLQDWGGSDHLPIRLVMRIAIPLQPVEACSGRPIPQLRWDIRAQPAYVEALGRISCTSFRASSLAAAEGDIDAAFHELEQGVIAAAADAGMQRSRPRRTPTGQHGRHKPFFDAECAALKRRMRALQRHGRPPEEARAMERQYHSVVRAKRRAYRQRQLEATLQEQRVNPRGFWQKVRCDHQSLPGPLCTVQKWDAFLEGVSDCCSAFSGPLPPASHPDQGGPAASQLNNPISHEEVLIGLRKLHNGRATGLHGYPAELLRAAQPLVGDGEAPQPHVLAPLLTQVLNAAFDAGRFPSDINHSLVTPVFKRGDVGDPANYRPISVTEPLSRLYATILNDRLVSFTEDCNLRAPTQAGFRPGLSTVHQVFTLQHFVDSATPESPLYCCFLDLKSAYDLVPREALWEVLRRLGIQGKMLAAIRSLYSGCTVSVKVNGRTGKSLPSQSGVKQGCPLSPTLFGLFADGLHRFLRSHCPADGVLLPSGDRLRELGYADDFVLLSSSGEGLQRLIGTTSAWCTVTGMSISQAKSKVMVFGLHNITTSGGTAVEIRCEGQVLQCVSSFVYLGVLFESRAGVRGTFDHLHQRMWGAFALIQRQYGKLSCPPAVGLLLDLYNACVPPAGSYGCEVWGFLPCSTDAARARAQLSTTHCQMLKQIAGLRSTVCTNILFRELGVPPLEYMWWKRVVRFWNSLASLPPSSLYYQVALHNCQSAVLGGVRNWAHGFMFGLRRIGFPFDIRCDKLNVVDWGTVRCCLVAQQRAVWHGLHVSPRLCPSAGAQRCTYLRWFARPLDQSRRIPLVRLPVGARVLRAFLRFRTGCHDLPVALGRRTGVPRSQRLCTHCSSHDIGDEYHLVFSCSAVQHIRDRYPGLFRPTVSTMVEFLWQDDLVSVVRFVVECLDVLQAASSSNQP